MKTSHTHTHTWWLTIHYFPRDQSTWHQSFLSCVRFWTASLWRLVSQYSPQQKWYHNLRNDKYTRERSRVVGKGRDTSHEIIIKKMRYYENTCLCTSVKEWIIKFRSSSAGGAFVRGWLFGPLHSLFSSVQNPLFSNFIHIFFPLFFPKSRKEQQQE